MKITNGRGVYTQNPKTGLIPAVVAGIGTYILCRIMHAHGWKAGEDCGYLYGILEDADPEVVHVDKESDVEVRTF